MTVAVRLITPCLRSHLPLFVIGNLAFIRRSSSTAKSMLSRNASSRAGLGRPSKAASLRQRNMALAR